MSCRSAPPRGVSGLRRIDAAGRERDRPDAERFGEPVVLALDVDDPRLAAEDALAEHVGLDEARLRTSDDPDDDRVRARQLASVELPRVVAERAAVDVAADVDAAAAEAAFGDERVRGLDVRGRRSVPGLALACSSQPPAERQRVGERLLLLAVESQQLEPRHLRRVLDLGAVPLELLERARGHGDVAGEPNRGVAVGELLLAAGRRLGLTSAPSRRLDEARYRPRSSWSATSVVRDASTSRIARSGEIGSIVTAIARTICACKQKRREERGADVGPRPARDPVGRVERRRRCGSWPMTSRARSARRRPRRCPSRSGSAAASRARPGRDHGSNATRIAAASIPGPKRADDLDVRARRAARRAPSSSRSRTVARSGVGPVLAARALDLPPRRFASIWRQTNSSWSRRHGRARRSTRSRYDRIGSESSGDGSAVPCLAEVAADLVAVGRNGPLDPLDPADRACPRGRDRRARRPSRPGVLSCSARSRSPNDVTLDCEHRGVRACARGLSSPRPSRLEWRGEQLEVPCGFGERDDRLGSAVRRAPTPAWGAGESWRCRPRTRRHACAVDDRQPLLDGPTVDRPEAEGGGDERRGRARRRARRRSAACASGRRRRRGSRRSTITCVGAQRADQPAPLERAEAVAADLVSAIGVPPPAVGAGRGGSGRRRSLGGGGRRRAAGGVRGGGRRAAAGSAACSAGRHAGRSCRLPSPERSRAARLAAGRRGAVRSPPDPPRAVGRGGLARSCRARVVRP